MTELAEAISKIESLISIENRDLHGVLKILQRVDAIQGEAAKAADELKTVIDNFPLMASSAWTATTRAIKVLHQVAGLVPMPSVPPAGSGADVFQEANGELLTVSYESAAQAANELQAIRWKIYAKYPKDVVLSVLDATVAVLRKTAGIPGLRDMSPEEEAAQFDRAPVAELGAFEKGLCDAVASGADKSFAELSENYRNMLRANRAPTWVVKEPGVRTLTGTSFEIRFERPHAKVRLPPICTYLADTLLDGPFFSAADAEKAVANYINTNRETLVAFGFISKE